MFADVSFMEAAAWKSNSAPDVRSVYGSDSAVQFGDLRLPTGATPPNGFPVIVFIHGGAWRSEWSKNYTEAFVEALAQQGFATWDLEFRRLGDRGGGYPGTFEDVADGADSLDSGAARFEETNPARMLPFGVPQTLMIGDRDSPWRLDMTERYAAKSTAAGDPIKVIIVPGANHMDVMDVRSGFARSVAKEARSLIQR